MQLNPRDLVPFLLQTHRMRSGHTSRCRSAMLLRRSDQANFSQTMATNAPTPDGYQQVFVNLAGSLSASNYMGLITIKSFDTLGCASLCDQAAGCVAFNMYAERDPSVDPNAVNCPNPPSITNYKCTLWGAPVAPAQATNTGQFRDSFEVVVVASNGTYSCVR